MKPLTWNDAEDKGLVKLEWVMDEHPDLSWVEQDCFDDEYRETTYRQIDQDGVWGRVGSYRCSCCKQWIISGSVWGFVGHGAHAYEEDIKQETLNELNKAMQP